MSEPVDWSQYDGFIAEAEKDNRIGDHDAVVDSTAMESWPDGSPRYKINFLLITAGNARADLTLSELPTPTALEQIKATGNRGRMRGTAMGITIWKQLAQHYGISSIGGVGKGMAFRVKTTKTKVDDSGKGGFIKVVAVLPKGEIGKAKVAGIADTEIPF